MTAAHVRDLLETSNEEQNLKIIHLIRDPLEILASMQRMPKSWKAYLKDENGTVVCMNMMENLAEFSVMMREGLINENNFLTVHYDQWMENLEEWTEVILDFLEVDVTKDIEKNIKSHWEENATKKGYLSTHRGAEAGQEHIRERWSQELSDDMVEIIEE